MLKSIGHSDLLAYLLQLQRTSEYAQHMHMHIRIHISIFIFISVEGCQPVSPVGLVADYALTVNLGVIIMKSGSLGPGQLNHPFMVVFHPLLSCIGIVLVYIALLLDYRLISVHLANLARFF